MTDDIAYYLYHELEKLGKRVDEGIMVSGFDDKPESTHMVPPLASCHADASFLAYLGIKQGYDLYKNGSTQNQYIDAHFIPCLFVDCENHEETEIGEFIRFCRAEKESNEYIVQGMTQYVFDNKLVYSSNYQETVWSFFTKCCHKAPSFSCGDIRQLFLDFINKSYRQITFDSIIYP